MILKGNLQPTPEARLLSDVLENAFFRSRCVPIDFASSCTERDLAYG